MFILLEPMLANNCLFKVLKGSLDLTPSTKPSVKIQIVGGKVCLRCKGKTLFGVVNKLLKTISLLTSPMGGKVCLRCKGKTLLGVVNKLLKTKILLTSSSSVLPYNLK